MDARTNPFRAWRKRDWLTLFGASTIMGLMFVAQSYLTMFASEPDKPVDWGGLFAGLMSYWYLWGIFYPCIVWFTRKFPLAVSPGRMNLVWHIPALLLTPFLHIFIYTCFLYSIGGLEVSFGQSLVYLVQRGLFLRYVTYALLVAISISVDNYRRMKDRELRASQLETRLAESQLQILKNQLQPHFLFNTLNAISSLMRSDPDAADEMIARLGALLRSILDTNGEQEIPLREELALLQHYTEIEKIRLGDKLTLDIQSAPELLDALVPSMILQPIVENAIRHGIAKKTTPGCVLITTQPEGGLLRITVTDDGPGLAHGYSEGVGLSNVRRRLEQLYGSGQQFAVANRQTAGVCVTLAIPLRTEDYAPAPLRSENRTQDSNAHR